MPYDPGRMHLQGAAALFQGTLRHAIASIGKAAATSSYLYCVQEMLDAQAFHEAIEQVIKQQTGSAWGKELCCTQELKPLHD